ncbi:MAG: glycosyltransferase family 4 protein [Chloroflexaceae bacterium]|nr:glycosyltransferase family 4 protein [Chloroflexaceae bacterium]
MRLVIPQRLTMAHGVRGGMETQAQILAEGLIARGHTLLVLTNPHPDGRTDGTEGSNEAIPVRYIAPGTWKKYRTAWWNACYQEIARRHRANPFDLLLSQSAGALGYLPLVRASLRLPCVVIIHGSMMTELRTRWRGAWSLRGAYRLIRHLKRFPWLWLLWRRAAPMVDHWVVVSTAIAKEWQRELGIPSERITVIPNGVDPETFRPDPEARLTTRQQLGISMETPLLLCVGRLEQEKGFQVAIQAVRRLLPRFPTLQLFIVGEGAYRKTLSKIAATTVGAVTLPGYASGQQVARWLAAADIFLMPTLRDEGLPLTIVEAMAAGVPVIASKAGGIPDAVDEGRTGMLVPMGSVEALTQTIETLLQDSRLRSSLARAARETAVKRLSRDHMVAATEHILTSVRGPSPL